LTQIRSPLRFAFLLAAAALALAGCDNPDGRAARAYAAADGADVDSAAAAQAAAEQAKADSIAEWNDRFGDRVPRPDSVRALYVNAWAAGSRSRMANLIAIADSTEINAFVIDLKESDTYLTYTGTEIALAKEIGADQRPASKWLPALVDTLKAHRIYPIARIVVFKDRMLAEQRPDLAIRNKDGGVWKDQKGKPWVNPYSRAVWDYNLAIAREALEMGFSEIQWDYVRFPDVVPSLRATMVFPESDGVSREDNIRNFLVYSKEQLAGYRVPVTADVFGQVTHLEGDSGIGQQWEKIATVADVVLPMVYPSHYYTGFYGFQVPSAHPYEIVRLALADAVGRDRLLEERGEPTAEVMPWLEAMTATWIKPVVEYGPAQLRSQIQATYDTGLKSWTLWNPGSKYDVFLPALRGADGSLSRLERSGWKAMTYTPPPGRLSPVIRKAAAAARAAKADSTAADSVATR
jgi:hypothetical protein